MGGRIKAYTRQSIKWRFTFIFVALITGILVLIVAVNTFFLEAYYTKDKLGVLENAYTTMDRMIRMAEERGADVSALLPEEYDPGDQSTETPATRFLRDMNERFNISIVVVDTRTDQAFATAGDWRYLLMRLERKILGRESAFDRELMAEFENYTIEQTVDRSNGSRYMESWGYFSDNRTSFIMSMPIAGVQEAVGFFNKFLIFIGLVALGVGSLIVYFASSQIAKPIRSLAKLSEKMSALDFTARYEGTAEDEIATLGHSMNCLAERLETTIGELKNANNELQSDIENKTRLDRKRQEFVANVSHELKTPIALIQGYAEGLQDGMAEDPDSRDYYCSVIVDEADKMNKMVRQLMNLSSLEQGMDLPLIELFDLSELVHGVLTSAEILLKQRDVRLTVDVPKPCMVWADEFKIEEVLNNYLNNALNHLTEPNRIHIYTEQITETMAEQKKHVRLHVVNSGKPIPEEDIEHIWEKFFKVDKAHSRAYGGSGLGLSIVKAIADAHHQNCGVQNTEGGVDFWFTLDTEQSN